MSSVKSSSNDGGSIKDRAASQGSFNFQKKYTRKSAYNLNTFVSRGGPGGRGCTTGTLRATAKRST